MEGDNGEINEEANKFNWNKALEEIRFKLTDFVLYNHKELMDLVLKEEFGVGSGDSLNMSLDSQVERFITSSQYRLYILSISVQYVFLLPDNKQQVYQLKFEEQKVQDEITKEVRVNKNTVTAWVKEIREGLLDEWDESGITLDNVYRFRKKYDWVDKVKKLA